MRATVSTSLVFLLSLNCLAQENSREATKPSALPFRISRETTYITEPLTKEGFPDYREALNLMMKKGVSPEDNAAVYYWRAIGPEPSGLELDVFIENIRRELGTNPFPEDGSYFISYQEVYDEFLAGKKPEQDPWAKHNAALEAPWKSDDYPSVKQWIEANEEPLKIVMEGTRRSHYYRPIVIAEENEPLIAALLPDVQKMRELARIMKARAMLAIGEERFEDASRDLIAMHRLARHVAQGATVIESLVGIAIDSVAREGDMELANAQSVTVAQLKNHQKQLVELPTLAQCEQAFLTERLVNLDAVQKIATQNLRLEDDNQTLGLIGIDLSSPMGQILAKLFQSSIDWNVVMSGINEYHDQIADAVAEDSFSVRFKTMQKLNEELLAEYKQASRPSALTLSVLFSPQRRGNHLRLVFLSMLTPALEQVVVAEARGNSNAPLTETALAVASYQKREGTLPLYLKQLVPRDLAEIPVDPFTGQPVHYLVRDNEAVIYCLGKNLQDDRGVTQQDSPDGYDIGVRIQRQNHETAN